MDFFDWQARKQGADKVKPNGHDSDVVEFDAPRDESIEVRELTASTTVIKRLQRFWTDRRR